MCWSLFLRKLQAFNFDKKRVHHRFLPVNIAKFLRVPILKNVRKRLLFRTTFPFNLTNWRSSSSCSCNITYFIGLQTLSF